MKFEIPQIYHASMFESYQREFKDNHETWIHGVGGFRVGDDYFDWLKRDIQVRDEHEIANGYVQATTYFVIEDDTMIGTINIRHSLNEMLLLSGGNIGYSVLPSRRRQGIATKILQFGKEFCFQLGMKDILVICHKNNIASKKTIERCGGVLENEVVIDHETLLRYWIKGEEK